MSAAESDERGETDRDDAPQLARPILDRLAELEIASQTHWHEPVFTVEESRALRDKIRGVHTKNLLLKDRKGAHFLLVCREDAMVDLKTVRHALGARAHVGLVLDLSCKTGELF